MRVTVERFQRLHTRGAAALLAARHARDRARDERLPVDYASPDACAPLIEQALAVNGAYGGVALVDGEMAGYQIGEPMLVSPTDMSASFFAPRSMNVWYPAHAAQEGAEYDVYRALYAFVAAHFVEAGYFDHNIFVSASDAAVEEACVSLGFGRLVTAAIRTLDGAPPVSASGTVDVHEASSEDARVIEELAEELLLHHTHSPIFMPYPRESTVGHQAFQSQLLADREANPHFVAYRDGKALGMNTFMAPDWLNELVRPEGTWYLYQGVVSGAARGEGVGRAILRRGLEWARERGYAHVGLHFASANISAARFWLGNGFTPVEHRMSRHVDERIAWANR